MPIKKKFLISFIIFLLLFSLLTGCLQKRQTFHHDGIERTYILHLPSNYNPLNSYPLVVVLHGGGGNAQNIEEVTNFSQKADEEGFIVVYPDGTGKMKRKLLTWNGGFCCGYALENNIDDVGYIKALIIHLKQKYAIDENMIYATGLSNGGVMTYRLGAELSDVFAAIAPVAGQIGGKATPQDTLWQIPEPSSPLSVMVFHGMNDSRVPYDGGTSNATHVYYWMSTNESISFWIEQNKCDTQPNRNISSSGNIIIDTYKNGINNTEVTLVSILNGSHSWPGGRKGWEDGAEPTQEIKATDLMWDFFKTHSKK